MRRAYMFKKQGHPSQVLTGFEKIAIPTVGEDDVLVRVKSAALNPVGYKIMTVIPKFIVKMPAIPECDFSGVVVRAGSRVTNVKLGDEVWGHTMPLRTGEGTLTDYYKAHKDDVALKPANMNFGEAAGLGVAAMTAMQALTEEATLKKGDRVFVNGGSGGVGVYGVQIARHLVGPEGKVVSSCSAANIEFVKSLGADEVIDYRSVDLAKHLAENYSAEPFNVFFDTIGLPDLYYKCAKYLSKDGVFVNVGAADPGMRAMMSKAFWTRLPRVLGGTPRQYKSFFMTPSVERAKALNKMAEDGQVKTYIDSTFELPNRDRVVAAYERMMSGRAVGKIVLNNDEENMI